MATSKKEPSKQSTKKSTKKSSSSKKASDSLIDLVVGAATTANSSRNSNKTSKSNSTINSELGAKSKKIASGVSSVSARFSRGKSRKTRRLISILSVCVAIVLIAVGGLYYFDIPPFNFDLDASFGKYYGSNYVFVSGEDLRVHFIDVGQGDSILIELPDGKTMLIDGGKNNKETEGKIVSYVSKVLGASKVLDYVMLTHTDSDHSGGLDAIFDPFEVRKVYMPFSPSTKVANDPAEVVASANGITFNPDWEVGTIVYQTFIEKVMAEGSEIMFSLDSPHAINNNQSCDIVASDNSYSINFYNPSMEMYYKSMTNAANKNNISPMLILTYNNQKILLTGDSDDDAEVNFLSKNISKDIDILKVAHHGGRQSTSDNFLNNTTPKYAIIMVGDNSHGHPTSDVLNRLNKVGSSVLRTDLKGDIVLTVSGKSGNVGFSCKGDGSKYGSADEYVGDASSSSMLWQNPFMKFVA